MDYCYNNAVIHVFLGNLAQLIVPHHNTKYKDSDKGAEEILEFAIVDPPTPADDQSNETPTTSKFGIIISILSGADPSRNVAREVPRGG